MDPLVITVAAVGAELSREQQPNLPMTPDELAADAVACREAGASIYHLHVRDEAGNPTMDVETFERAAGAITAATDLIVQFTSGGGVHDDADARIAPLDLKPEMATLTTGTVNFGDEVFSNPLPLVVRLYARMRELGILPEFEIFDSGMIGTADRVYADHGANDGEGHHRHFDFVLGVPGGMPAWPDALDFLSSHIPPDSSWTATGIGAAHLPITARAIELGGHVRTGFEDVRWFGRGELASSNAQLIARVAEMARAAGRSVAEPAEARALLGIKR